MARIVSFVILLAILIGVGIVFYRVIDDFLLPMFLALLLVVIFAPVHEWFVAKCGGRLHLAAGLTTITILLIILIPISAVLLQAVREANTLYNDLRGRQIDLKPIASAIAHAGDRLGLEISVADLERAVTAKVQEYLAPAAIGAMQIIGRLLLGLAVMIFSLYFFLADGPAMIRTLMRLSPLDDKYERQLIDQFSDLSRTVVLATLAAAVAQGIFAGFGFYFAGVSSVFLLTVLTILLAMVPFVGAVSVWVPVCVWLFYKGDVTAAIVLGVYCAAVVSTVDNLIKPLILHGRAKLHPLLALLGVLGGVQALGPIGIFIGPMVVVFLQTLLNMLRMELETMTAAEVSLAAQGAVATGAPSAATAAPPAPPSPVAQPTSAAPSSTTAPPTVSSLPR